LSTQLRTFEIRPLAFSRRRDSLRRQLANFQRRQPISLCSYYRSLALEKPRYPVEALAAAVDKVTLQDMRRFQASLVTEANIETFVCGNVMPETAEDMMKQFSQNFKVAPLPFEQRPQRLARRLKEASASLQQFVAQNPNELNSALEIYFQVGTDQSENWLLLALLAQLLEQPFYNELRTKQQLGYIVSSSVTESSGVRGLVFAVQSQVLGPPEIEQRVDAFLESFRKSLEILPQSEIDANLDSLATQAVDVDKRAAQQAARFWSEISQGRYDYGRPWRVAERLRGLNRAKLVAFYDSFIAPDGEQRRRLATHVYAMRGAPASPCVEPIRDDGFYPAWPRIDVQRV